MIWKWIQRPRTADSDQPLFEAPRERRRTYRVLPHPAAPVKLEVAGWSMPVTNVSVGGVALQLPTLPLIERVNGTLSLPDEGPPCSVTLVGIEKSREGIQHCRFVDLDPTLEERLFRYILARDQRASAHPEAMDRNG